MNKTICENCDIDCEIQICQPNCCDHRFCMKCVKKICMDSFRCPIDDKIVDCVTVENRCLEDVVRVTLRDFPNFLKRNKPGIWISSEMIDQLQKTKDSFKYSETYDKYKIEKSKYLNNMNYFKCMKDEIKTELKVRCPHKSYNVSKMETLLDEKIEMCEIVVKDLKETICSITHDKYGYKNNLAAYRVMQSTIKRYNIGKSVDQGQLLKTLWTIHLDKLRCSKTFHKVILDRWAILEGKYRNLKHELNGQSNKFVLDVTLPLRSPSCMMDEMRLLEKHIHFFSNTLQTLSKN